MSLCAILMCGGRQTRMGSYDGPKQLVPVCGEPVALRTIRLLRSITGRPLIRIVAPASAEWEDFAKKNGANRVDSTDQLFLRAAASAIPYLDEVSKYLVLCGDVVFSPSALSKLIDSPAPVSFLGRFTPNLHTGRPAGELYGFAFNESSRGYVIDQLQDAFHDLQGMEEEVRKVTTDEERIAAVAEKNLRLWHFMHILEEKIADVLEVDLWDYIDDIDGPDDLERLPRIEAAIRRREC